MNSATNIAVHNRIDMFFKWTAAFFASIVLLLMVGIFVELVKDSHSSLQRFGVSFLISQSWNPVTEKFGAASSLFGTLLSTALALLMAIPLSLVIALFLVELAHPVLGRFVGGAIELLAAIPSIIYGMWGLFIFAPFMADYVQPFLSTYLGFLPFFQGTANGLGMLSAGIILALMILPFVCSVTRDVFQMVPSVVKESAYGMGATTWEVTRKVTLRYGMRGVIGAGFLGLGRALGETMAVTFVIGNTHRISMSLFDAGNTIASTLANEFAEASEPLYLSALINLGLVLFILTVVVQVLAQLWLWRIYKRTGTL
jgi:phosphate transport system permease protein